MNIFLDAPAKFEPVLEDSMNKILIPHDALVFVGDGQRALFLRNAGDSTLRISPPSAC